MTKYRFYLKKTNFLDNINEKILLFFSYCESQEGTFR